MDILDVAALCQTGIIAYLAYLAFDLHRIKKKQIQFLEQLIDEAKKLKNQHLMFVEGREKLNEILESLLKRDNSKSPPKPKSEPPNPSCGKRRNRWGEFVNE